MKSLLLLFIVKVYTCSGQDTENDGENGMATATCIYRCIEAFERQGVEEQSKTPMAIGQAGCDALNLDTFMHMCDKYSKVDTCLQSCQNDETKKVIMSGLHYICIYRLEEYKKHISCYKEHCSAISESCSNQCGSFSDATQEWKTYVSVDGATNSSENSSPDSTHSRRKRQQSIAEDMLSPKDICKYSRCYASCSRPDMEKYCGVEAYELLKQTSNILLSFLLEPLQSSGLGNVNDSEECRGIISSALSAESNGSITDSALSVLLFCIAAMIALQRAI